MKNAKKLISILLLLCIAISATACSNNDTKGSTSDLINQKDVVATVNGKAITQKEFDDTLAAYKKMVETQSGADAWDKKDAAGKTLGSYYEGGIVLDNMIQERVLYDAAVKEGFTMTDEALKTELDTYKGYFSDDAGYQDFLKSNNMTEEYLKDAIKKENIINQYVQKNVETLTPTDDELKTMFEDKMGKKVRASHILVSTEGDAKAVIDRLNKGEAFEAVAKDVSLDGSKDKGGDLDFFAYTAMVKEFSDAAFSMKVGDVSAPVKSQYGYHIIKVTDQKADNTVTIASQKEGLTEFYKTQKYNELVENLKKNADIKKK